MNKIWFTSDTHFGSQRTLELSKRPFKTVAEMNDTLIKNWNDVVDEFDIVYHLGDFGDYRFIEKLNGSINLICGNYDRNDELNKYKDYFNLVFENGFSNKCKYTDGIRSIFVDINMEHEPSLVRKFDIDERTINLFGHIHKLCMVKPYGLNVGVDCHNFKPIDMETVLFYHNAILNHYDGEVFK